ncbi:MAG: phosphate/phosphite/phosphonate ABC transporter substrate-binding protein [Candidatus Bipolaricaulia bacterium]
MKSLKLTSCMAENADFICYTIARYISERLHIPTEFINDIPWQERERLLDVDQIQVGWICGLPCVWKVDQPDSHIELLAAPVMRGARYQNRPIYFSDVVVYRDSRFHTFADLQGASWAYNEPRSHSGYNLVRYHLATLGETSGYFGKVVESGAHQTSLQMILDRQVDASAIDSTVLELELRRYPEIRSQIRVIETLGPSPIPPWVILKSVPQKLRTALCELLLHMHRDPQGCVILLAGQIDRFVRVEDRDYDAIRHMARKAEGITL